MTVQLAGLSQTRWHRFLAGMFAEDMKRGPCKEEDSAFMRTYEEAASLLADVSALLAARQFDEARWALVQLHSELGNLREQAADLAAILAEYDKADKQATHGDDPAAEERATRAELAQGMARLQHRLDAAQDRWDRRIMTDDVLFAVLALFARQRGLTGPGNTQDPEAWALWFSRLPPEV